MIFAHQKADPVPLNSHNLIRIRFHSVSPEILQTIYSTRQWFLGQSNYLILRPFSLFFLIENYRQNGSKRNVYFDTVRVGHGTMKTDTIGRKWKLNLIQNNNSSFNYNSMVHFWDKILRLIPIHIHQLPLERRENEETEAVIYLSLFHEIFAINLLFGRTNNKGRIVALRNKTFVLKPLIILSNNFFFFLSVLDK